MPTNLKRVQVLLRPEVLEIIETLSNKDGLALSKTCALLIEEMLEAKGLLDRSTLRNRGRWQADSISKNKKTDESSQKNTDTSVSEEDLELLRKIKLLKELGI